MPAPGSVGEGGSHRRRISRRRTIRGRAPIREGGIMAAPGKQVRGEGRPGASMPLLGVAPLILLGLLLVGPPLPMRPAVGLALVAVALVASAWIVAGPRL